MYPFPRAVGITQFTSKNPIKTEPFLSSFCSDYAFWHDKVCYNNSEEVAENYSRVRYCDTYKEFKPENETQQSCNEKTLWLNPPYLLDKEETFYCKISKTCIPRSWTCNGLVNCIFGEDEDFELCKSTFPESATIKCLEGNRGLFNVTILAVPCNGIIECKHEEDEKSCTWYWSYTINALLIAYVIVTVGWCFTYFYAYMTLKSDLQKPTEELIAKYQPEQTYKDIVIQKISDELETTNLSKLKGDALANLKVGHWKPIIRS